MTNISSKIKQYDFEKELSRIDSKGDASFMAERNALGTRLMKRSRSVGNLITAMGFGGAPFVYQMWEAEQAGAGVPFAIAACLVGCVGAFIGYDSHKSVREYQRREVLAKKKLVELEQIAN